MKDVGGGVPQPKILTMVYPWHFLFALRSALLWLAFNIIGSIQRKDMSNSVLSLTYLRDSKALRPCPPDSFTHRQTRLPTHNTAHPHPKHYQSMCMLQGMEATAAIPPTSGPPQPTIRRGCGPPAGCCPFGMTGSPTARATAA